MNTLTREEKLARFQELTKDPRIQTAQQLAVAASDKARLLIDHPHGYREWQIIGTASVRAFYYLESSFPKIRAKRNQSAQPLSSVYRTPNSKGFRDGYQTNEQARDRQREPADAALARTE